ncbi:MAG: hypothetical protein ABSF61_14705 [Anaerolineales bacterium]|jgi:hypothetical protein
MAFRLAGFAGSVYTHPMAKLRKLVTRGWKGVKDHPIWSKVAANLITHGLELVLGLALAAIGIASWVAGLQAVID